MAKKHKCSFQIIRQDHIKNKPSLSPHRLGQDRREDAALSFLYRKKCNGYKNEISSIKGSILYMDSSNEFRNSMSKEQLRYLKLITDNEEVVDIVIHTIFQWFGTNVGLSQMERLIKDLRSLDDQRDYNADIPSSIKISFEVYYEYALASKIPFSISLRQFHNIWKKSGHIDSRDEFRFELKIKENGYIPGNIHVVKKTIIHWL